MIASLSAGVCYTPAGCPSPALPDLWLPPRAPRRDAAASPAERQGCHPAAPRFQRPTTPAAVAAVRAARRAAGLRSSGRPCARGPRSRTCSGPATRKRQGTSRSNGGDDDGSRRADDAAPPGHAAAAHAAGHATAQKARKALPPLPPPKPAAVDASLGTYASTRVGGVPRRDVTIDGASLEFCARAGARRRRGAWNGHGHATVARINVLVQYLDSINLEGERVLELGAGAGLAASTRTRAKM